MRLLMRASGFPPLLIAGLRLAVLAAALIAPAVAQIRGAALVQHPRPGVLTWGTELRFWPLAGGSPKTLKQGTDFGPGGCVADVDGDGQDDLMVREHVASGAFLWLRAPRWEPQVIERATEFRDCLPFAFDGHRGVLIPHFNSQLRLYEYPKQPGGPWAYSEIYSIYTASKQGGLVSYDVDGDGLLDLFVGNYWMRNPGRWDLPWRLFNMNTFFDTPDSALARQAVYQRPGRAKPDLLWAESEGAPARFALLERPEDEKQAWPARMIEPAPDHPRALLVMNTEGDTGQGQWPPVLVGAGDGVRLYRASAGGVWTMSKLWAGAPVLALFRVNSQLLAVTAERVERIALPIPSARRTTGVSRSRRR
jgi:hypothetical protein